MYSNEQVMEWPRKSQLQRCQSQLFTIPKKIKAIKSILGIVKVHGPYALRKP